MPHPPKTFDVTVVGAGPAGSMAAYCLAKAGASVCLIDQRTFPRDKVCGDAVSFLALDGLARMGLAGWLEAQCYNTARHFLMSAPNGEAVRISKEDNFHYGQIIPRLELDNAMVEQAVGAGAQLYQNASVSGLSRLDAQRVQVASSGLTVQSSLVIAADGAHASFTKSLGLVKKQPNLVAVRAYFENIRHNSLFELHYDPHIMPYYFWIFPMRDGRANVGLGTYVQRTRKHHLNLKEMLNTVITHNPYVREHLHGATMVGAVKGYPLRAEVDSVVPLDDNVMVAGEAAGLVNPFNGEGIASAIVSGELAATRALEALASGKFSKAHLRPYQKDLDQHMRHNYRVAHHLRHFFNAPAVVNRAVKRAQHDKDFLMTIFNVFVEIEPSWAFLRPTFVVRLVMG